MPNRRKIIWYHPNLKEQARELRNNCTEAESILWQRLRGKQLKAYDFHRQKPLLYYIVDFYCHELNLVIELDGGVHDLEEVKMRDSKRQEELEEYGITFLRFNNSDVLFQIEKVIRNIEKWIDERINK